MTSFYTSPLLQQDTLLHGFFTRHLAFSKHTAWKDTPQRVAAAMGVPAAPLVLLNQCHSTEVIVVQKEALPPVLPPGDALVTADCGLLLGILTADCVPILFADTHRRVIGAAHGGWRGLSGGIIENTLTAMEHLGAQREGVKAVIGPCIGADSYQVGQDVVEAFPQDASYLTPWPVSSSPSKYKLDLVEATKYFLRKGSVRSVDVIPQDTFQHPDLFFSYRYASCQGEPLLGNQISCIIQL